MRIFRFCVPDVKTFIYLFYVHYCLCNLKVVILISSIKLAKCLREQFNYSNIVMNYFSPIIKNIVKHV